jgi:hypothetical protein
MRGTVLYGPCDVRIAAVRTAALRRPSEEIQWFKSAPIDNQWSEALAMKLQRSS